MHDPLNKHAFMFKVNSTPDQIRATLEGRLVFQDKRILNKRSEPTPFEFRLLASRPYNFLYNNAFLSAVVEQSIVCALLCGT